ncbi:hypothetical protein MCOR27_011108 [Pyricularia oryzae]|uniref:Mitochondrial carrier protein n=5 Tax=Pyricularia TaxID=48558 RepID=A0ABQ8NQP7_PYRGI|nr:solute carrier family 25 member 33 [Pyricularia oryzae 70-15]ELQ42870.1 solute carrier family 25 member 33 [Pyricularia oryzae Y34]KAH8847523.1 hypothetical protein MCOR01_000945 [Pyricularia oryzae]KAI6300596.1 hypothetical protein MCOR33_003751 [Pyricularia grisea]EHA52271.1 solute carrier family 25 member 33 [Pyricularia oryzae 70-15]KAH9427245.1 hypothetical protein MCOR02_012368 [Pyricularia oryzae]
MSSHDRRHQVTPPVSFDSEGDATAAGDHGPLTSPAEFYPPPPPPTPESIGISVPEPLEAMPDSPRTISPLEKWAAHATSSQFNALSGAIGGFTSGVVVCPLDVIKTKLQAQGGFAAVQKGRHVGHHRVYSGLLGTGKIIWREEGIRGMYRGLGPIILGYLPTWAVWFTVYNKSKEFLGEHHKNSFIVNFWSSIVAGASSTIVTNPIWVIKTRLMSQSARDHIRTSYSQFPKGANTPTSRPTLHSPWHYKSTMDAARKMYTTEGITSFYSGLTPALLGLTHVAVQFPAYEYLKTKFTGQGMGAVAVDKEGHQAANQWMGVLAATILSKVLASSATYPHEVIRTRLQTQQKPMVGNGSSNGGAGLPRYQGIARTFRTILREEGWRAFYAGMGTNLMRAVPAATVTMLTYEYVMRRLNQAKIDGKILLGEAEG